MATDSGRRSRILILILVFCVAVLAAYIYEAIGFPDPDQFWHLATGRYVVQNQSVPTVDVFSWWGVANHREWVAQEWLFGVIAYAVHAVSGFTGLYFFMALLEGAMVLLVYALSRARGVSPLWSFLVMVASLFGSLWYVVPRPQVLTFCLVLLTALLLQKDKPYWALPVVIVGANVHGGIWPLYVLLFAFYEFPKRWWLVVAATAATLVNPNPLGVFVYPFQALLNPSTGGINEFQPTALWSRKGDLAMYLAVMLAVWRRRIAWRDAGLALAFVLLSLSALRHLQWFYVIVLPILAPYIAAAGSDLGWLTRVRDRLPSGLRERLGPMSATAAMDSGTGGPAAETTGSSSSAERDAASGSPRTSGADEPRAPRRSRIPEILLVGALAFAVLFLGARATRTRVDAESVYPREMVAYLQLHDITRFYNAWHDGGYLIWRGVPPMVDGRGDPFVAQKPGDKDLMADHMATWTLSYDPHAFFEEYDIEYAMVPASAFLLAIQRDPAFQWVKQTETHVLFKFDPEAASREDSATASQTGASAGTLPGIPGAASSETTAGATATGTP